MNKKFGVSYNVFSDSIELLEPSIKNIRKSVDHISIVYQTISNIGQQASLDIETIVKKLKNDGLVDEIIKYTPVLNYGPHNNEVAKRNLGVISSRDNGCDYHLSMDTDEFYITEELEKLKQFYIDNDLDGGYCQMLTYYKNGSTILDPPEDYYISLFYKVKDNENYFKIGTVTPVTVDPTRSMISNKYHIFTREEIQMLHLSYVRNDIRSKLENSSARQNYDSHIENIIYHFNSWVDGDQALVAGLPPKVYDTKKVEEKYDLSSLLWKRI